MQEKIKNCTGFRQIDEPDEFCTGRQVPDDWAEPVTSYEAFPFKSDELFVEMMKDGIEPTMMLSDPHKYEELRQSQMASGELVSAYLKQSGDSRILGGDTVGMALKQRIRGELDTPALASGIIKTTFDEHALECIVLHKLGQDYTDAPQMGKNRTTLLVGDVHKVNKPNQHGQSMIVPTNKKLPKIETLEDWARAVQALAEIYCSVYGEQFREMWANMILQLARYYVNKKVNVDDGDEEFDIDMLTRLTNHLLNQYSLHVKNQVGRVAEKSRHYSAQAIWERCKNVPLKVKLPNILAPEKGNGFFRADFLVKRERKITQMWRKQITMAYEHKILPDANHTAENIEKNINITGSADGELKAAVETLSQQTESTNVELRRQTSRIQNLENAKKEMVESLRTINAREQSAVSELREEREKLQTLLKENKEKELALLEARRENEQLQTSIQYQKEHAVKTRKEANAAQDNLTRLGKAANANRGMITAKLEKSFAQRTSAATYKHETKASSEKARSQIPKLQPAIGSSQERRNNTGVHLASKRLSPARESLEQAQEYTSIPSMRKKPPKSLKENGPPQKEVTSKIGPLEHNTVKKITQVQKGETTSPIHHRLCTVEVDVVKLQSQVKSLFKTTQQYMGPSYKTPITTGKNTYTIDFANKYGLGNTARERLYKLPEDLQRIIYEQYDDRCTRNHNKRVMACVTSIIRKINKDKDDGSSYQDPPISQRCRTTWIQDRQSEGASIN